MSVQSRARAHRWLLRVAGKASFAGRSIFLDAHDRALFCVRREQVFRYGLHRMDHGSRGSWPQLLVNGLNS
jgi:hypothetical protein